MRCALPVILLPFLAMSSGAADNVVLRVGDTAVLRGELELAKEAAKRNVGQQSPDEVTVLRLALDQVVSNKILAKAARKAGVTVSPEQVLQDMAGYRARFSSQEEYARFLQGLSLTEQDVARIEEELLLVQRFIAERMVPLAAVSEEEARKFYEANPEEFRHPEQVRLRTLLFKVASDASAETEGAVRARAEDAIRRLKAGEEFAKLAGEVSEDESTRGVGGELGWVRRGLLFPELESAVFRLQVGETTGAIRTPSGYHLMEVEGRRGPGVSPFDEVKARLTEFLRGRNLRELLRGVIDELRAENPLEVLDPALKAVIDSAPSAPPSR